MNKKIYLMLGGTFLPAFIVLGLHIAYHKRCAFKMSDLLLFAGASAIGGFVTAKMLNKKEEGNNI